jgi:hypothetical protein
LRVTVDGKIKSVNTNYCAGIASRSYTGSVISYCVNNATVRGAAAGGLVAELNGQLEYSANYGDVIGSSYGIGGLATVINSSSVDSSNGANIYNCYNAGNVHGALMLEST